MKNPSAADKSEPAPRRSPIAMLAATVTLVLIVLVSLVATSVLFQKRAEDFAIKQVSLASKIQQIKHYDEALTANARLAAATSDPSYVAVYNQLIPQLDQAIAETKALEPRIDLQLQETGAANMELVAMERKSFILDHAGKGGRALALLSSSAYQNQKDQFKNGFETALTSIQEQRASIVSESTGFQALTLGLGIIGALIVALIGLLALRSTRSWARANASATAAHNSVRQLESANSEITSIGKLGNLLQSCENADEAHAVFDQAADGLFVGQSGAMFLLNASRNLLEVVAEWGSPGLVDHVFSPTDCWALRSGGVHHVAPETGPTCGHVAGRVDGQVGKDLNGYVCVPMAAQGETMGVLYLEFQDEAGEHASRLAITVAEQVALSLANLRLRETLRSQSIRDPLTGLFNRRYMEESFERELRRAIRNDRPLGVIMADLDHFKRFNDDFGHEAGDVVLKAVGRLFVENSRVEDIACRFGGEELILIMPESSIGTTAERAELLRTLVETLSLEYAGHSLGSVTLSLGVSSVPQNGASSEELIATADRALYEAKASGRNQVVVAPQGISRGSHRGADLAEAGARLALGAK